MNEKKEQLIKAMEFLKDWSNYLLVTTVAAIGWVSTQKPQDGWLFGCILAFGLSAVCGILTLAVIPPTTERISDSDASIYGIKTKFNILYLWPPSVSIHLKMVCWPQHILFVIGVVMYILSIIF